MSSAADSKYLEPEFYMESLSQSDKAAIAWLELTKDLRDCNSLTNYQLRVRDGAFGYLMRDDLVNESVASLAKFDVDFRKKTEKKGAKNG